MVSSSSMPWDFWLIFAVLGVFLPWRGYERMRHMMTLPEFTSRDRIKLYVATILFQWTLTLLVAWRALARGLTLRGLAVSGALHPDASLLLGAIAGAVVLGAAHWANVRRMARSDHPHLTRLRALGARLFPRSAAEMLVFLGLAMTAGICEEFLFRGFVMGALYRAGLATWAVVTVSSAMFGVAHLYQGRSGAVGTGLLGIVFAVLRIAYYSLVPPMVWHAAMDVVAGLAGAKYLVGPRPAEPEVLNEIHR